MATTRRRYFERAHDGDGKRQRTRAIILDAAIAIFARRGIAQGSIVEIAERAGLSNGAFYYHFRDKAALLDAVGGAVAATLVRDVDEAIEDIALGSERVAAGAMLFISRGTADPAWGQLIIEALDDMGEFRDQIFRGVEKDVRVGIGQGLFHVPDSRAVLRILLGIAASAMRLRLEAEDSAGIVELAAESILRVLGLPPDEAGAIVARMSRRVLGAG